MPRERPGCVLPLNNHEVLATEREPVGQPRRARGDDEASVARSAARGATGIITRPNIAKRSNHVTALLPYYPTTLLLYYPTTLFKFSVLIMPQTFPTRNEK